MSIVFTEQTESYLPLWFAVAQPWFFFLFIYFWTSLIGKNFQSAYEGISQY